MPMTRTLMTRMPTQTPTPLPTPTPTPMMMGPTPTPRTHIQPCEPLLAGGIVRCFFLFLFHFLGKTDTEIVSYVTEGMFEPHLVVWYQANQTHIDSLTLDAYLLELSQLVLKKNWSHEILKMILSSSQGNHVFIDWKIKIKNLNTILTTSAPAQALTKVQLKVQLQSNLHPDLRLNLSLKPVLAMADLATWAFEVKEQDDCMRAEDACTQKHRCLCGHSHGMPQ